MDRVPYSAVVQNFFLLEIYILGLCNEIPTDELLKVYLVLLELGSIEPDQLRRNFLMILGRLANLGGLTGLPLSLNRVVVDHVTVRVELLPDDLLGLESVDHLELVFTGDLLRFFQVGIGYLPQALVVDCLVRGSATSRLNFIHSILLVHPILGEDHRVVLRVAVVRRGYVCRVYRLEFFIYIFSIVTHIRACEIFEGERGIPQRFSDFLSALVERIVYIQI